MADIKWIKIATDIFDDEKILLIESMPDADAVIVIWFKLLCLAGKQNNSGVFTMHDRIAYTDEMFATIFRRPVNTVRMALDTFENFGMIERINGVATIPNWGKHQNFDKIESNNAYMREYMREYRKKQKQKALSDNVINEDINCKVNSKSNVSPLEENREDKNRLDNTIPTSSDVDGLPFADDFMNPPVFDPDYVEEVPVKEKKHKYGEFKHVLLKDSEHEQLSADFGERLDDMIRILDEYIETSGKKYKNHNLVLRGWVKDRIGEQKAQILVKKEPTEKDMKKGIQRNTDLDGWLKAHAPKIN